MRKIEKRRTRARKHAKHLIFELAPSVSLWGTGQIYIRGPKGRVYEWMGWMDGWLEWMGRGINSVPKFSSSFGDI